MEEVKDGKNYACAGNLAAVIQYKPRSNLAAIGKVEIAKEIIKFLIHILGKDEEFTVPFNITLLYPTGR